jgi:hypothetical protein
MATELENASITFTEEAEVALRRAISRVERQVRGRAVEEAVRRRGVPAEVTGSDIQRAFSRFMFRRISARERERATFYGGEHLVPSKFTESGIELEQGRSKKKLYERIASGYIWTGAAAMLVGLLWAPTAHWVRNLASDPAWRFGFLVTVAGFATLVVGIFVKFYVAKLLNNRRNLDPR